MKEESSDEPPTIRPLICIPVLAKEAAQKLEYLSTQIGDIQTQESLLELSSRLDQVYQLFMVIHEPEPDCDCLPENAKGFQVQAHYA